MMIIKSYFIFVWKKLNKKIAFKNCMHSNLFSLKKSLQLKRPTCIKTFIFNEIITSIEKTTFIEKKPLPLKNYFH